MSHPDDIIKYMFEAPQLDDSSGTLTITPDPHSGHPGRPAPAAPGQAPDLGPAADPGRPVPLERVEAQICELAGHLAAATCRFLVLLGDFDARRGWVSWDMNSCAQWLSWKCQMSSGAAREHVRVARALRDLPVLRSEFTAGRLSYAKVRALTRIATPATEHGLAEIAGPMTANQLERFARAHRKVTAADDTAARIGRRLAWRFEDDGSLAGTFRLPPLAGAVLIQALRAAAGDLGHLHHDGDGVSAETPSDPQTPGHPADPARCHVQDGPAVSITTAQMLTCTAALSWMRHGRDGTLLPSSPALPGPEGTIEDCHDAEITPDTIIPAWYGEHLDLDYAIHACFANAGYQARHQGG
jgi:hypothetical protein